MRPSFPALRSLLGLGVAAAGLWQPRPAGAADYIEPPALAERVASGDLPPVADRVPAEPLVVDLQALGKTQGDYGGTLRIIEAQAKDTRRMVVYGYARLAGYTPDLEIRPDLARAIDVVEDRIFTIHLRKGHKWSDGEPFTAEDFRYYWEDVVGDDELSPHGAPRELLVEGKPPTVTFVDAETIRYEWDKPNPFFLPALADAQPLEIWRPAHYLKKYHRHYVEADKLKAKVEEAGQRNWVALHFKYDQSYKNANPKMPSLQPWVLATKPPSDRFMFVRNPFFHRVDPAGHQLPYIDDVAMTIASSRLIPAKTGAGETDLQSNYLSFGNYAFLKQAAAGHGYEMRRWTSGKGSKIALFPNQNVGDEAWRKLFQTSDFRRALSVAINREDINQAIYYGLGKPQIDTVSETSPLYDPALPGRWAQFDPALANRLLDGLGLTETDGDGIRLLPDGRPMMLVIETAGEDTEQVDVLELIGEDLRNVGIKILVKPSERDTLSRRLAAGSTMMSVWTGLENALPKATTSPDELAPTNSEQNEWPLWGMNYETKGTAGEPPTTPVARTLLDLNNRWRMTTDVRAKEAIWKEMLAINADEALRIGIVSGIDQIVVVSERLRNVPETAVFNWNPGSFYGIYRPETFYFAEPDQQQAQAK
ncbi:peptide ABC transporter substrate-binding protein [Aureimonas sp. Leaf454]|uniref:ABC transporter substrate-binding protein n=1 Tax=Aureimonas sp. Leaf454 TaxID=1736381 RepID=UPI0006F2334A|nr:ABC transporter substrate-binding protein [Aureimonas sp. Leaf454]KQT41983.1 peptide ABC transporter substrate-binding protein [Aureimonas sp. Leaf454]